MKIKITSDSTCDLSPELLRKYDIQTIPLYVNIGDQCLKDGVEATPDDIYAHVAAGGEICSTAAVNIADYADVFGPLSESNDAVIHVDLSAELSSCCQNAHLAAGAFGNVSTVDSRNLSTGNGYVALRAAELAASGMEPAAIVDALNALTPCIDVSFIPDDLEYLRKGGRCSSIAALGANLLHLHPCIEVRNGGMRVGKKYRGSFEKILVQYVRERLSDVDDLDLSRIFITHSGGLSEDLIDAVRAAILDCAPFEDILITKAGCTISSHCGPGTLGIVFARKSPLSVH